MYIESRCTSFLDVYDYFPREIFRADTIRPFYMFFDGGFYADMDFECLKPLAGYLSSDDIIVGSMGVDPSFPHSIPNAMFASPPFEGFWLLYLSEIALHHEKAIHLKAEYVTGPVVLKRCVEEYLESKERAISRVRQFHKDYRVGVPFEQIRFSDIRILPGIEWYPLDWSDAIHLKFRNELLQSKKVLGTSEVELLFERSNAVTYWTHTR